MAGTGVGSGSTINYPGEEEIVSFQKGLHVEQTVLCSWGSRKYRAIVKSIEGKGKGPDADVYEQSTFRPTPEANDILTDVFVSPSPPSSPGIEEMTTAVSTQTDNSDAPSQPNFSLNAGTQTDGYYVTHEFMCALQEQLQNLAKSNASLNAKMDAMSDLLGRSSTLTPASPSRSPFTPPAPSLPSRREQPSYGKLVNGNIQMRVENGSVPFVEIPKQTYERIFYVAKTATSFVRQLLPLVYSREELVASNFEGGEVLTGNGYVTKPALERPRMASLLGQVELEFPGSTFGKANMGKIREAINAHCRTEARKKLLM
ncbi:hypothetical protein HOLleu_15222 [Holothuria leucospilota]|uniref:BEN domain-containing protein n=1 Tax=Holothuria leucospilota TaxID=206669 RepID=A0A9Q1CA65_HOLLE|nr:hypothetical protein HOLleu_15222 [Holothuria leucospilota]